MRGRIQIFFLAATLCAQTQDNVLTNAGAPMKLPFACAEEELVAAGMSCTDENPCAIYLELSGVSASGKKLVMAGNLHGPSSTIASVLLVSDEGGLTWKETARRIRGAALDQVQWLDATHGWAGGEIQVPLSRDPFFLITSDGGASWREKPVMEDGGPGDVVRFWFDSADHGELIVDGGRNASGGRYQMYESGNGGDNWRIVSKTAQMPKLRHTPGLNDPDYRVGVDNRTKSYVVEKRDGAKWAPVASFLVQTASCGLPVQPVQKEAPPDDAK